MLNLASTTDKLQVVTGAASTIDVHASWVDYNAGTYTPSRTNTATISTAATTDVVASPAASTVRNVRSIYITNNHATASCQVTVQHTDGTNVKALMGVTLLPGENLNMVEDGSWHHRDAQGGEYNTSVVSMDSYGGGYVPTGIATETVPRIFSGTNTAVLTSGTLHLQAIFLRAGQKITNISFFSGTQASVTPTHGVFGLYDANRNLLAATADFTSEAWAANTIKTKAVTTPYTVPASGMYYLGIMIAATTVPSLLCGPAAGGTPLRAVAPIIAGNSTTALTTTLPNPAAAIGVDANNVWAGVS